MILRVDGDTFVLITQPDHAQLAEHLVAAVRTEPALGSPRRDVVLLATREHDNGWTEVDAEPTVDPATGRPCDFMHGPAPVKQELWPRGITRVAELDLRAGALVAEHAITVYEHRRSDPGWVPFFQSLAAMRDTLLERSGTASAAARRTFDADYRCVRLGDAFSLQFCGGWTELQTTLEYRAVMESSTLLIAPDPFGGATVPLRVVGRRIPARPYASDADLRSALAAATPEVVSGHARGVDELGDD